jgi:hypothetical protein
LDRRIRSTRGRLGLAAPARTRIRCRTPRTALGRAGGTIGDRPIDATGQHPRTPWRGSPARTQIRCRTPRAALGRAGGTIGDRPIDATGAAPEHASWLSGSGTNGNSMSDARAALVLSESRGFQHQPVGTGRRQTWRTKLWREQRREAALAGPSVNDAIERIERPPA